jgi:hypothetical protein
VAVVDVGKVREGRGIEGGGSLAGMTDHEALMGESGLYNLLGIAHIRKGA